MWIVAWMAYTLALVVVHFVLLPVKVAVQWLIAVLWWPGFDVDWRSWATTESNWLELRRENREECLRLAKDGWRNMLKDGDFGKFGGLLYAATGWPEVWDVLKRECITPDGFVRPSGSSGAPWSMAQMCGLNWAVWQRHKRGELTEAERRRLRSAIWATIFRWPYWHFKGGDWDDFRAYLLSWQDIGFHLCHTAATLGVWKEVTGSWVIRLLYWLVLAMWLPLAWWNNAFIFVGRYFLGYWFTAHTTAVHARAAWEATGNSLFYWVLCQLADRYYFNPEIVALARRRNFYVLAALASYDPSVKESGFGDEAVLRHGYEPGTFYDLMQVVYRALNHQPIFRRLRYQVLSTRVLAPAFRGQRYLWEENPLKYGRRSAKHNVVDFLHLDALVGGRLD